MSLVKKLFSIAIATIIVACDGKTIQIPSSVPEANTFGSGMLDLKIQHEEGEEFVLSADTDGSGVVLFTLKGVTQILVKDRCEVKKIHIIREERMTSVEVEPTPTGHENYLISSLGHTMPECASFYSVLLPLGQYRINFEGVDSTGVEFHERGPRIQVGNTFQKTLKIANVTGENSDLMADTRSTQPGEVQFISSVDCTESAEDFVFHATDEATGNELALQTFNRWIENDFGCQVEVTASDFPDGKTYVQISSKDGSVIVGSGVADVNSATLSLYNTSNDVFVDFRDNYLMEIHFPNPTFSNVDCVYTTKDNYHDDVLTVMNGPSTELEWDVKMCSGQVYVDELPSDTHFYTEIRHNDEVVGSLSFGIDL